MMRESIHATGIAHAQVKVGKQAERLYFDLFIPEKAEAFTSIIAVAEVMKYDPTLLATRPWQDGTAGHVALRWNKPGNVFFMQKVDLTETFEKDYLPCGLLHPGGAFWNSKEMNVSGARLQPVAIRIPSDCRHVRGAYLDVIDKARGGNVEYRVDIYLTYTNRP